MDFSTIVQIVGSLGFPIVACCGLFWLYNKTLAELRESVKELTAAIRNLPCMRGGENNGCED